jgi:trans-aconitate 2-methyltransferase
MAIYLDVKILGSRLMPHTWDPDRYLAYADERGRPFVELVARVGATDPAEVVDLGCGPGNLTGLLAGRWPGAHVVGLDSSPEMIAAAQAGAPRGGGPVDYAVADLRDWTPPRPVDVLVSNATLQWVPGHLELLPRLVAAVADGGWLAFQVPGNFDEPSHTLRAELAGEPAYAEHTAGVAAPSSHDPADYYDVLAAAGCEVDVWETTYTHVLRGPDPVFTWVSGTGARPTLQALPDDLRAEFEREFRRRLAAAYPVRADGTVLLPFRRVFAVARVGAA